MSGEAKSPADSASAASRGDSGSHSILRWAPLGLLSACLLWITSKALSRISDPDDWWHLRLGNDLLHHPLTTPRWSSFADQTWVPTEPVPEIASALVERWLGYPGLAVMFGLALFTVTVSLYALNRQLANPLPAVVVTAASMVPIYGSMTARPQLVSFVLLPAIIAVWIRTEHDLRPRWWLVPLVWIWSLCHGFWFIGVAYGAVGLLAVVVSRRASARQLGGLAGLVVATFAVVLANPFGPRVFEAPFRVNDVAEFITEWQRPWPLDAGPFGVWLMVAVTLAIWAFRRPGITPFQVALLLSAMFWAWYAERTVIIGAIVVAPVLAGALEGLTRQTTPGVGAPGRVTRPEWNVIGATFFVAALILVATAPSVAREPGDVPLALDSRLDHVPAGSGVYTEYRLGGWVAWRHPDLDQFIDGLATPYSREHYLDFFAIQNQDPGWYRLVNGSHVKAAVVNDGSPLATALLDRGWVRQGSADGYVLLTRPGILE